MTLQGTENEISSTRFVRLVTSVMTWDGDYSQHRLNADLVVKWVTPKADTPLLIPRIMHKLDPECRGYCETSYRYLTLAPTSKSFICCPFALSYSNTVTFSHLRAILARSKTLYELTTQQNPTMDANNMISAAVSYIRKSVVDEHENEHETSLEIVDLDVVHRLHLLWQQDLPRIKPHYG